MERSLPDEDHFRTVYVEHLEAIVNYGARRTSHQDAVDVASETFTIAWRRLSEVPDPPMTRPWLYGVARRVLANEFRSRRRAGALHERLCAGWAEVVFDPAAAVELAHVRTALQTLSADDQELILLAGAEELTSSEIAEVLEVSREVARNRLSRARYRMRLAVTNAESQSLQEGRDNE